MRQHLLLLFFLCWLPVTIWASAPLHFEVDLVMDNDTPQYRVQLVDLEGAAVHDSGRYPFEVNGETYVLTFQNGRSYLEAPSQRAFLAFFHPKTDQITGSRLLHFYRADDHVYKRHLPLWLSILPPLLAIFMALIFKEVVVSLVTGIWLGAFIAKGFHFDLLIQSFFNVIDKYLLQALVNSGHISVIVFSLMIGGMVAVISKNGGMSGVVNKLSRFANSARNSQLVTWLLGILIFFDDYANTLIVGTTMRSVTDKFKISREKLAYIVDSTAAPIAAIAFITTWIGAELGYIQGAVDKIGLEASAYSLFFHSLAYSYYPVLSIIFIFFLVWMNRDYGPMLQAEKTARNEQTADKKGEKPDDDTIQALAPLPGIAHRWYNAFFPVLTVIGVTILGLIYTGYDSTVWQDANLSWIKKITQTIGSADSYVALLWGSLSGATLAILLTVGQRLMSIGEAISSLIDGYKTMLPAILILILAWSLAIVTEELHTAAFLTGVISDTITPAWMPILTFVLAGFIAFSTGSSWGTMAILYPLILPTTWSICQAAGLSGAESLEILYPVISVVLAGSVLGDHCSPISDTTILSSLATSCDHIEHVNTQLPYALTVGGVSTLLFFLSMFLSVPWYLTFAVGIAAIYLIIRYVGKPVDSS